MKKYLIKQTKKSLSLFLAVLMLLSCWVWVAPEKAEAINTPEEGYYYVEVFGNVTDWTDKGGFMHDDWTCYYSPNNGTGTEESIALEVKADITKTEKQYDVVIAAGWVKGFPTRIVNFVKVEKDGDQWEYNNLGLRVGDGKTRKWVIERNGCNYSPPKDGDWSKGYTYDGLKVNMDTMKPVPAGVGSISSQNTLVIPSLGTNKDASTAGLTAPLVDQYGVTLLNRYANAYSLADATGQVKYTKDEHGVWISTSGTTATVSVNENAQIKLPTVTGTNKVYVYASYSDSTVAISEQQVLELTLGYPQYKKSVIPIGSLGDADTLKMEVINSAGQKTIYSSTWEGSAYYGLTLDNWPTGVASKVGFDFHGFWSKKQPSTGDASYNAENFAAPLSSDRYEEYKELEGAKEVDGFLTFPDGSKYFNAGKQWDPATDKVVLGPEEYHAWWSSKTINVKFYDADGRYLGTQKTKYGKKEADTWYPNPMDSYQTGAYTYATFSGKWQDISGMEITEGAYDFKLEDRNTLSLTPVYSDKSYNDEYRINFVDPRSGNNITGSSGTYAYRDVLDEEIPTPSKPSILTYDKGYTYSFEGWTTQKPSKGNYHTIAQNDDLLKVNDDWVVRNDATYYAVFRSTVKEYVVTFTYIDSKGNTVITEPVAIPYGSAITTPDEVNRTYAIYGMGYTLEGWDYVNNYSETVMFAADGVLTLDENKIQIAESNLADGVNETPISFTANYDEGRPSAYTITFKYKGDKGIDYTVIDQVYHGEKITQATVDRLIVPATYDDGNALYTFANKWKVTEGTADKADYTADELISFSPTSHVTFEAVYDNGVPYHTVKYMANNMVYTEKILAGKNVPAWMIQTGTDADGNPVMEEYVPMDYEGENGTYEFVGWFDEEQADETFSKTNGTEYTTESIVNGDLILYAQYKFEPFKYTIKFMNHDGTVPLGSVELEKGHSFSQVFYEAQKSAQTRPADKTYKYTFIGWDQPYDENHLVCEGKDVTYTAVYRPDYIYYKANWYSSLSEMQAKTPIYDETDSTKQIGTEGLLATTNYTYEGSVYAPSVDLVIPEGEVFAGWYYLKDGEETPYQRGMTITADMDFYATYTAADVVYEVTTVVNGVSTKYEVAENEVANIVPRPLDGWKNDATHNKFDGWFTDEDFETAFDIVNTVITKNITIYAKFTEAAHIRDQKEVVTAPTYYAEGKEVKWCACNKEGTTQEFVIPMLTDTVAPTGTIYLGTQGKWSSTDEVGAAATDDQTVTLYANADTDIILTINDTAGNCADENCDGTSCVNCVYNPSGFGKGVAVIQGIISTGVFGADTTEIAGIKTIYTDKGENLNNTVNRVIRLGSYEGLADGETYIAYYYAKDKAGNVLNTKVRTAKFIYDTTAPVFNITGEGNAATAKSTPTYCSKATVTGIEVGATVTVNGKEVALTTTSAAGIGTYDITEAGNYVITVTDKAGNSSSKKIIVAAGHSEITSEKEVTCTEGGYKNITCAICGKVIKEETIASVGHQYGEITTVAPTCEKGGYDLKVCTVCGYEEKSNEKPATEHTYEKDEKNNIIYEVITAVTCKTAGKKIANCTVCGKGTLTEIIPVPAEEDITEAHHVYGAVKVLKPTCTEDGMYYKSCKYCYNTIEVEVDDDSAIKATGHKETYTKIEKYPTCKDPGVTKEYCKKCNTYIEGKDGTIPATGKHTWVASEDPEKTFEATGDEDGQITYICSACNSERVEVITKIEKFSVSFYDEDGETLLFTIPDVLKGTTITENYTWTVTTGEGEEAETVEKTIVKPTKASDEENDYKFAGWVDANDNAVKFPFELVENMTLKAKYKASDRLYTHIFMAPAAAVATAGDEDNYIEFASIMGKYNSVDKKPSKVPALKATATETYEFIGWKDIDGKPVDDFKMTGDATFYADFKVTPVECEVIFYNGNDYVDSVTVNAGSKVEPTTQEVTKASDEAYHYTFNGWYADAELTKAFNFAETSIMGLTRIYAGFAGTAHSFETVNTDENGNVVTFAPTCIKEGQTTLKCTCGYEKVETIPATGEHVYGDPDENGVKHCTTEGCDAKIEPEASKVTITFMDGTTVLDSFEVEEGKTIKYTAPAEKRTTEYDYKFYMWTWTDADGETVTSDKAEITVTAGAEDAVYNVIYTETVRKYRVSYSYDFEVYYSEYIEYGKPLPTIDTVPSRKGDNDGHYIFSGWTFNGEALGENLIVDKDYLILADFTKKAHVFKEESSSATCTEAGGYREVCECGFSKEGADVVPALGHDWSDPVIVEATYDAPGSITKICKREGCGEKDVKVIPQLTYKSLKVTVTKNGAAADDATVSLYIGEQWIVAGKTKNGVVSFKDLAEGTYTVLVVKDSDSKTVDNVVINGAKEITVELVEESSGDNSGNNNNAPSCSCSCHRSGFWGILFRFFHKVISWITGKVNCCADPQL